MEGRIAKPVDDAHEQYFYEHLLPDSLREFVPQYFGEEEKGGGEGKMKKGGTCLLSAWAGMTLLLRKPVALGMRGRLVCTFTLACSKEN